MYRLFTLLALPAAAAAAQTVPQLPSLDAARATARQIDQATQAPRTGKESMDRVTPLLTIEPHGEDSEQAWRKAKEDEARKKLEAAKPK